MAFDTDLYLERLGIEAPSLSAEGLALAQEAQLSAIAFESADPYLGTVPDLDPSVIAEKTLRCVRGGYCFELNGLFGEALAAFGFAARPIMARVRKPEPGPRSHLAFVVRIDGQDWLADTGFGGPGARRPVLMEPRHEDEQGLDAYRVVVDEASGETLLQKRQDDGWLDLYGFLQTPVLRCDLEAANYLCATWAGMPFSRHLMLNRLTPHGRLSAFDTAVTEIRDGIRSTRQLENAADLVVLLRDGFGLGLDPAQEAAIAVRLGLGETSEPRSHGDVLRA